MFDLMLKVQEMRTPLFNGIFEAITATAETYVLLAVMCIMIWCVNKKIGYRLGYSVILASAVGAGLKMVFRIERPWIRDERIVPLREHTATGYSFPSGHTLSGGTMWFSLSRNYKKTWLTITAYAMMILIAMSRVYLGVHTPLDILTSLVLIIPITLFAHYAIGKAIDGKRLMLIILSVLTAIGMFFFKSEGYYKMAGLLISFLPSQYIENKYIRFSTKAGIGKQISKVLLGIIIVVIVKEGLSILSPDELIFDFIRYFLIAAAAICIAPWLFVKLKLSKVEK